LFRFELMVPGTPEARGTFSIIATGQDSLNVADSSQSDPC